MKATNAIAKRLIFRVKWLMMSPVDRYMYLWRRIHRRCPVHIQYRDDLPIAVRRRIA